MGEIKREGQEEGKDRIEVIEKKAISFKITIIILQTSHRYNPHKQWRRSQRIRWLPELQNQPNIQKQARTNPKPIATDAKIKGKRVKSKDAVTLSKTNLTKSKTYNKT